MTKEQVKDIIVSIVNRMQGCKATELACDEALLELPSEAKRGLLNSGVPALVDELVAEGRLVEVEYVLPNLSFRAKSYLFPTGTKVKILSEEK